MNNNDTSNTYNAYIGPIEQTVSMHLIDVPDYIMCQAINTARQLDIDNFCTGSTDPDYIASLVVQIATLKFQVRRITNELEKTK